MRNRKWTHFAAGVVVLLLALAVNAPAGAGVAAAQPKIGAKPHSAATTRGIGVGGHLVGVSSATVYQCPETFCNRGTDYAGNDIAAICSFQADSGPWILTLDHADNITGFLRNNGTFSWTGILPTCPGGGEPDVTVADTTVFQCPEYFCNKGVDYPGNAAIDYCFVTVDSGGWELVLDLVNYVVGFMPNEIPLDSPEC